MQWTLQQAQGRQCGTLRVRGLQAFFGCRACRDTGFEFFLSNIVHARPGGLSRVETTRHYPAESLRDLRKQNRWALCGQGKL